MRRIALRSLAHDRGKLVGSLAGVGFASTLLLAQIGLYAGFLKTSCSVITEAGGDVWVMAKGTEVLENGETLAAGSRSPVAAHACVDRVRAVVMSFAVIRKAGGGLDSVQLIGFEPEAPSRSRTPAPIFPWTLTRGLPQDLHGPNRVAIDGFDAPKLQITGDPMGTELEIQGHTVTVAGVTEGVRSFTLLPFTFAEIDTARRLVNMDEGQANYWVADLADPSCAPDVIASIERANPDLSARTRQEFQKMTQDYWIAGSGAGSALGFSALMALVVGTVIVGQTLYAITKEHLRELGTLKAIGATSGELVGFVLWQAAVLAFAGGAIGLVLALCIQRAVTTIGLEVVLSPAVLLVGALAILLMCAIASIGSVRKVIGLEALEVFK